jgi:hypothetical protein
VWERTLRVRSRWALIALAIMTVGVGGSAATAQPTRRFAARKVISARHGARLMVAAWRWRLSLPNVTSNKTSCFTKAQRGPVWFLGGSETGRVITRTCAIPAGRYIMLYSPSVDCSTLERPPFHATSDAGLQRCAKHYWQRHPGRENLTVDGVSIRPAGYIIATPAFSFTIPRENNWLGVRGHAHGRAAVYGAISILRLSRGTHTLVQVGGEKVTYQLTIG